MVAQPQTPRPKDTSQLMVTALTGGEIYETGSNQLGMEVGDARTYHLLPHSLGSKPLSNESPYWRIELHDLDPREPYGIDLIGDIALGRGADVDIDFDQFNGHDRGVSRRHIILRPTASALFVIDLESTNGTRVNGLPLGRSEARAAQDGDFVSLGRLTLTLRVIDHTTLGALRQQFRLSDLQEAHAQRKANGQASGDVEETVVMPRGDGQDTPADISMWMSKRFARIRELSERER